ncbi:Cellulase [Paludibacter propionicigenes WB4]|uniref:Cellulase n=1 Tax=Paludibacter propionicigenes (strain DSM 17365 / JCM 13257 / WB4) TaxID=694427 RepID=E4T5F6_PALPW|nr:glycoside hydrolase family 5 protein [Paludibacter propionicigenes]ADQ79950.1 Cellulase [Paludibacter propionicigenes WB4]
MKLSTKIALIFIVVMPITLCNATSKTTKKIPPANSPVALNGKLQVIGTQLSNSKGNSLALHGASLGWHNLWPRFYNAGAVKWLVSDWKCNVIRASMGVGLDDSYLENPDYALKCMTNVIDAAIKNGVYVLIDFHSHKLHTAEAKKFFTGMAAKYKNSPNVIYEIWNEPDYYSWKVVKQYSEEVISTIRAIDPTNIILVGSPHWDQDIDSVAGDPIVGQKNIMYTMHFYAGTHKKWLRDKTDAVIAKGIPIFVSECAGMDATGDGPIDQAEWKLYIDWMDRAKLSWCVWSVSDKNETCSMLLPRASSTGNWDDGLLKSWGKISRSSIREMNK